MNFTWILKLLIMPVIGLALMIAPLAFSVRAMTARDLVKTDAPGTARFEVTAPGSYTIWRSTVGLVNDSEFRVSDDELPAGLTLHIRSVEDGTTVPLEVSLGTHVKKGSSGERESLAKAELSPGSYELISTTEGESVPLIVSKSFGSFKGFFLGAACFFLGLLILIIGIVYAVFTIIKYITRSAAPRVQ